MPTDINSVFDHPVGRAEALGLANVHDRLLLTGYEKRVEIGAFQAERNAVQRLIFDAAVEISPPDSSADDVDQILSYDRIHEAIDATLAGERFDLLETLAERIATRILAEPGALRVFLRIGKPDRGPFVLSYEMARSRGRAAQKTPPEIAPRVALVSAGELTSIFFMQYLKNSSQPVVIVIEVADLLLSENLPKTNQDRIFHLATEQAAWAFAAGDGRMDVVASRTELDWALRNGRLPVWAPSRMIFDTPRAPVAARGRELAAWLAAEIGATGVDEFPSPGASAER